MFCVNTFRPVVVSPFFDPYSTATYPALALPPTVAAGAATARSA